MTSEHTGRTIWDQRQLADPHGQPDKAVRVRAMFDGIAPTYERVNHILSAWCDTRWRRRAVRLAKAAADDRVLDLACGTGDFARAFAEARPQTVVGCDFSTPMLRLAAGRDGAAIRWCQADAVALPFADGSFSLVSCAFGVRNFQDMPAGFREIHRLLAPGGRAVILEFSVPRSRFLGRLYLSYFHHVFPWLATLISRDRTGAYRYLPKSVSSFANAEALIESLQTAGFARVEHWELTIGIVTVFVAWKN
ncbi:MAG TPA: bifunctional demethylmenaquinone methyltransferase/2-methoxy-6-polyprenyl-1,4-benzoquinol methylase UbiE [Phycisphaerae bacterium]|nr:bifunctional demethylmenaquinone methyltransferase/2-methoxy-6-polyprenyl-1,4-benzoquinol methylase UbiE [Phycisphaerae bacterium]